MLQEDRKLFNLYEILSNLGRCDEMKQFLAKQNLTIKIGNCKERINKLEKFHP